MNLSTVSPEEDIAEELMSTECRNMPRRREKRTSKEKQLEIEMELIPTITERQVSREKLKHKEHGELDKESSSKAPPTSEEKKKG